MKIRHLIIASIISIALMFGSYKFNALNQIKAMVSLITVPINFIADIPHSLYKLTREKEIVSDNNQELLLLRTKLQQFNALLLENQRLINLIGNNQYIQDDNFLIARVKQINKSRLQKNIVINKGLKDSVAIGNIVLGSDGVLGVVTQNDNYYSTVRLITDPLQYTPVINLRSGERAIAKGYAVSKDRLVINFVDLYSDVELGDIFATSGEGMLFNSGYIVGKVVDIIQENQNLLTVVLGPAQLIDKTIFVVVDRGNNAK